MNNCKHCKYYGEYNDGKFTSPVCKRYSDLKSAADAIKNSDSCKHYKGVTLSSIKGVTAAFKDATENIKQLSDSFICTSKNALNVLEQDGAFIKTVGDTFKIDSKRTTEHYSRYVNIIKKDLDRLEQLEEDIKEYKKRYYEIDKENTDLFTSLDTAYKENEKLAEEIKKLKMYKKAIKILKDKLALYLENDKIRAILPIGVSNMNKLTQNEYELLKEVLNETK